MKRVIKNYTNIEAKHIALIAKAYPEGFGDEDLQVLSMPNGKYLRALEVTTEDTIYLFRIDDEMLEVLEDATDDGFELDVDAVATPGSGGKSGKPPVDLDEVDNDDDGDSDREDDRDDDDSDDDSEEGNGDDDDEED
jgi:hypothetical protein